GKITSLETIDDVGRTWSLLRHAHIERPVGAKGESALGLIELHGGDADIQHHTVDILRIFIEARERPLHQPQASARDSLEFTPGSDRIRIPIDSDHRRAASKQRLAVAAGAESAVDDDLAFLRLQCGNHLVKENRNVTGRSANGAMVLAVTR